MENKARNWGKGRSRSASKRRKARESAERIARESAERVKAYERAVGHTRDGHVIIPLHV